MSIVGFSALAGGALLHGHGAEAALVTKFFKGDRTDKLDFQLFVTYDDSTLYTVPKPIAGPPAIGLPPGAGTQCSLTDTTKSSYANGDCYVNTDGQPNENPPKPGQTALASWEDNISPFTGYLITSVSGKIIEPEPDGSVYNVLGLAKIGSFEGGIPPFIQHYFSDNLINPEFLFTEQDDSLVAGKGLSQGGFVIITDDPDYQYQLFSDRSTGELAGCGSGTCREVTPRPAPAPLPILGAAAAFGSLRKLRNLSALLKTNLAS
jgi:hypothetical protein